MFTVLSALGRPVIKVTAAAPIDVKLSPCTLSAMLNHSFQQKRWSNKAICIPLT